MENWPSEKQGSTGENVKSIQYLLVARGSAPAIDGDYGPKTAAAVEGFQHSQGLTADGQVGPMTWPRLIIEVQPGSTGDAVKAVQSQLNSRRDNLTVDGDYGPRTESAVQAFQGDVGVAVDGVVGPVTWSLLADTSAGPTNLTIGPRVAAELVAAATEGLPASDFTGLRTGSCFYAYDPATKTYWAGVSVVPNPNSLQGQVSRQDDGAYQICTRPAGGQWSAVNVGLAGTPGTPCPIQVPPAIASLWGWPAGACHPAQF